jgi:hypothetical protein
MSSNKQAGQIYIWFSLALFLAAALRYRGVSPNTLIMAVGASIYTLILGSNLLRQDE